MAQDEGRFGRVSVPKKSWAPKGIRPKIYKQIVRQSFYAYSAVCPSLGKITSLILPYANTEMMNIFLKELSFQYQNYEVIMQIDQAGWHKSKALNVPGNIHLIEQPAYSPELNPVEHIWDEVREKYLFNETFDDMEEVVDKVCTGLNELSNESAKITSMTNFPHLRIVF
jgi:hypothetical protein